MNRPPTILSPHGEGYCRKCRFVIGLDERGMIDAHSRGQGFIGVLPCGGGGACPPKLTPYSSRKSAFTSTAPVGTCPECQQGVTLRGDGRLTPHENADSTALCRGAHHLPLRKA